MMDKVSIRKAVVDDLNAIGNLWQEFMDFHKKRDPHFSRSTDGHERFKEFISGHMISEMSRVLVAEQGTTIVGYCLATLAKYPPVFENRDYGMVILEEDGIQFLRNNSFQEHLTRGLKTACRYSCQMNSCCFS